MKNRNHNEEKEIQRKTRKVVTTTLDILAHSLTDNKSDLDDENS